MAADETWCLERQLTRPGPVTSCAWSPDGTRLATVGGRGSHSSTLQNNLSAFYVTGGAVRGCFGGV